ncbi:MAG: hypothetical protein H0X17_04120 [Deltaproteobacteria bacterium]|nr:hypothetical protein [Deltaproteobacteria bacterium]
MSHGSHAVADWTWLATVPEDKRAKRRSSGISGEREAKVLAAWKAKK